MKIHPGGYRLGGLRLLLHRLHRRWCALPTGAPGILATLGAALLCLSLVTSTARAQDNSGVYQTASENCESLARAAQVVRIDVHSERLFVVATERDLVEAASRTRIIENLKTLVADCQPGWAQDWNVSFFSDAALAGYKDDEAVSESVMNGVWVEAYLGEFAMPDRKLTIYPAMPERSQWYAVE